MKEQLPIWHSPEVFAAYFMIDMHRALLEELYKGLSARSPLDRMVDTACGMDQEKTKEAINILKSIIKNKKIIQADHASEQKVVEALRATLKKASTPR
jgi:hypothetical protein